MVSGLAFRSFWFLRFRGWDVRGFAVRGFPIGGSGYGVSRFRVSMFTVSRSWVCGFAAWVTGLAFEVSPSGFGGFGFGVLEVSGSGFVVSGLGFSGS